MEKVKVTKREYFGMLREIVEGANVDNATDLVDFIDREVERLSKKATGETKTQKENKILVDMVREVLAGAEGAMTLEAIKDAREELADFTSQKLSALVKKLVDEGSVTRGNDGKKAIYEIIR